MPILDFLTGYTAPTMAMTDKRSPWQDEFNTPDVEELRMELPVPAAELFDAAREFFNGPAELKESVRWYGDCWFWTIAFFMDKEDTEEDDPVALLVPAPDNLQVAAPLDRDFLEQLNTRRMKRAIRDGLDLASDPYSTEWGVWPLTARNQLEDLISLFKQRLAWLRGT